MATPIRNPPSQSQELRGRSRGPTMKGTNRTDAGGRRFLLACVAEVDGWLTRKVARLATNVATCLLVAYAH